MSRLVINHHFFYSNDISKALKGPKPDLLRKQIESLKKILPPALNNLSIENDNEPCFSITIDDGSKSFLDVANIFIEEKVPVCLCICGATTESNFVLSIHKLNLLRAELGDKYLIEEVQKFAPDTNVENAQLKTSVKISELYRYDQEETRKLKILLNYCLSEGQRDIFLDEQFEQRLGSESHWSEKLYLKPADLNTLRSEFQLAYHGRKHLLWSSLNNSEFKAEVTPSDEINSLMEPLKIASIPFGMEGSFKNEQFKELEYHYDVILTMGRNLETTAAGALLPAKLIHRFDQADIFTSTGELTSKYKLV